MLSLAEGIVKVGNVPTKHYLGEEFESQLLHFNMETVQRSKLEYEWETEIENPPRGLVGPYPFDWMFVATKNKGNYFPLKLVMVSPRPIVPNALIAPIDFSRRSCIPFCCVSSHFPNT